MNHEQHNAQQHNSSVKEIGLTHFQIIAIILVLGILCLLAINAFKSIKGSSLVEVGAPSVAKLTSTEIAAMLNV